REPATGSTTSASDPERHPLTIGVHAGRRSEGGPVTAGLRRAHPHRRVRSWPPRREFGSGLDPRQNEGAPPAVRPFAVSCTVSRPRGELHAPCSPEPSPAALLGCGQFEHPALV